MLLCILWVEQHRHGTSVLGSNADLVGFNGKAGLVMDDITIIALQRSRPRPTPRTTCPRWLFHERHAGADNCRPRTNTRHQEVVELLMRVLLVEDDFMIGAAVEQALKDAAYAVDWVMDGKTAIEAAKAEIYDVALLDLGLPETDGRGVLHQLRQAGRQLPVIIVTARDGIDDRIDGLDLGADDYLIKPFEIRELLARMRAVLRRQGSGASATLSNGTLSLNPATWEASYINESSILTAREFALLQALLIRPGTIMSRGDLEGHIYGWNEEVESNAVEFLIHSIRKKLGALAIRNVRGVGWMVDRAS